MIFFTALKGRLISLTDSAYPDVSFSGILSYSSVMLGMLPVLYQIMNSHPFSRQMSITGSNHITLHDGAIFQLSENSLLCSAHFFRKIRLSHFSSPLPGRTSEVVHCSSTSKPSVPLKNFANFSSVISVKNRPFLSPAKVPYLKDV